MAIIQLPDGGDVMGCSVESAHRDVIHRTVPMVRNVPAFKSVTLWVKNSVCVCRVVMSRNGEKQRAVPFLEQRLGWACLRHHLSPCCWRRLEQRQNSSC